MKILDTGAAGFIGFHLSKFLLDNRHNILGIDNINYYYNMNLRYTRLDELGIVRKDAEPFLYLSSRNIYE